MKYMRCKEIATLEAVCSVGEYNLEDSSPTTHLVSITVLGVGDMAVSKTDINPPLMQLIFLRGRRLIICVTLAKLFSFLEAQLAAAKWREWSTSQRAVVRIK